jgi:hypothetical protein
MHRLAGYLNMNTIWKDWGLKLKRNFRYNYFIIRDPRTWSYFVVVNPAMIVCLSASVPYLQVKSHIHSLINFIQHLTFHESVFLQSPDNPKD